MTADSDPGNYKLGVSALESSHYTDAIRFFEDELANSPNDHEVLHFLGQAHAGLNEHEQAMEYYRKSLDVFPEFPEAEYSLACSLIATERSADAKSVLESALSKLLPGEDLTDRILEILNQSPTSD